MNLEQFLIFLTFPMSGLLIGFAAVWITERETAKYDEQSKRS